MRWTVFLALFFRGAALMYGAVPLNCAAGLPLGDVRLQVQSDSDLPMLPLRTINRLGEGDKIVYTPVKLRVNEKGGKIALVVAPAPSRPGQSVSAELPRIQVLEPKAADKAEEWNVPFRAGVVALVYGPTGVDAKRVKQFLSKDDDLITQLADYAERTAQTEALLSALAGWTTPGAPSDGVSAALNGFASQYGIAGSIDRTLPRDQQMEAAIRAFNPALASVDPVSPDPAVRLQQSTMLAASVAGMFLGNPVGLAAGGAALFMNMRQMMFPNTEFRSSFAQVATSATPDLDLCGKREAPKPRTRIAFLWATRIPNAAPPSVKISHEDHLPQDQNSLLSVLMDDPAWRTIDRAHDWRLRDSTGAEFPVKVRSVPEQGALQVDLSASRPPAGEYRLTSGWDWDSLALNGSVFVSPLNDFKGAQLTPDSQDRLREQNGKTVVQAEGADFEFVEKLAVARTGDKYSPPWDVPFSLPRGERRGPQDHIEFELDTKPLAAGDYSLLVVQGDHKTHTVPFKVLPPGPRMTNLPLALNAEPEEQRIVLKGENLERLVALDTDGATLKLGPPAGDRFKGDEREIIVNLKPGFEPGVSMELRAYAQDTNQPVVVPGGVKVVPPKPAVTGVELSLPPSTEVTLKKGELPAGGFVSASLHVRHVSASTKVHLRCGVSGSDELTIRVGEQLPEASVQLVSRDSLFLSFDPGKWQAGCTISAVLDNGDEGISKAVDLGRVVRLPHVETFQLTEEKTADNNNYLGKLVGTDLETIAKVGWAADHGVPVMGLPAPVEGGNRKQSLQIALPWPPPSPHAPLIIWFRGESQGRVSNIRY
jgi:hypothetical protein